MLYSRILSYLLLFSLLWIALPLQSFAQDASNIRRKIIQEVANGSVLLVDEKGVPQIIHQGSQVFVPASIIKIFTSEVALKILGEKYRFKTEFYVDAQQNLAIKGWGDPFLISEEIALIAGVLKQQGLHKIRQIYLDASAFQAPKIPGVVKSLNPYDALNGALVVNFNSLNVGRKKDGSIYSAEAVTPLTALGKSKAKQIKKGKKDRINLTANPEESLRYVGELFGAIFRAQGITIEKTQPATVRVDDQWQLKYTHHNSKDLSFMLQGLLKYSNNFIANQLFLTIGAVKLGYPASLEKSRQVFKKYIHEAYNPKQGKFIVDEASGLSRKNRVTGLDMLRILYRFRAHHQLLPKKNGAWLKSGTLTGVYNYAGYLDSPKGLLPFVILLNQGQNTRNKILRLLQQYSKTLR